MSRERCFGIDIGSNKIVISQTNQNTNQNTTKKPSLETLGDFMDLYKIPNTVSLVDSPRVFGNSVSSSKAWISPGDSDSYEESADVDVDVDVDPTILRPYKIHGEDYMLPDFYVRNMIMSHVKDVIRFRIGSNSYESVKAIAFVPQFLHTDDTKLITTDMLGIRTVFMTDADPIHVESTNTNTNININDETYTDIKNVKIIPLSGANAITFAYMQKYMLNNTNSCEGEVLIIDIGHIKCRAVRFNVKKNNDDISIEQIGETTASIGCKHIDEAFAKYVMHKIKKSNPQFECKKAPFMDQIIKLKHQLSTNQKMSVWIQGLNVDVSIIITREELNEVISSLKFKETILTMINGRIGFCQIQNGMYSNKRHIEIVGGGARIPYIIDIIKDYSFDRGHIRIGLALNPDEAIAEGANVYSWLYDRELPFNLSYSRSVKNDIKLEYPNNSETYFGTTTILVRQLFTEGSKVLTTFNDDISAVHNMSNSDTVKVSIAVKGNTFKLYVGPKRKNYLVIKMLNLPEDAIFVDVYARYTLVDSMNIVIKYRGTNIKYDITAVYDTNVLNFNKEFTKYHNIEKQLLTKDNDVDRKLKFTNYLEDYFNSKDDINDLIRKIEPVDYVKVDDTILIPLTTPIKELYDFYQFCRAYMYTDNDNNYIIKHRKKYIDTILKDREVVITLTRAMDIINNIKSHYNK